MSLNPWIIVLLIVCGIEGILILFLISRIASLRSLIERLQRDNRELLRRLRLLSD